MNEKTQLLLKKAEEVLGNPEMLEKFAQLNDMAVNLARHTLEHLVREPEVSEKIETFVFESDNPELKGYYAGEEKGYQRGHEAGWGKGVATGVLSTLGIVASAVVGGLIWMNKDK